MLASARIESNTEQPAARPRICRVPAEEIDWKTCLDEGTAEDRNSLDLAVAIHHISGAASFVFECPHGLREKCQVSFEQILEIQFGLYEAMLEFVLRR